MALALGSDFDTYINRYRVHVPLSYAKALAWSESRGDAYAVHPPTPKPKDWDRLTAKEQAAKSTGAVGLFQITETVRKSAGVTRDELLQPEINTRVAMGLLNRILTAYEKHPSLKPDWSSRNFVELLTFGWNAGYSEAAGVGRVAGLLEKSGVGVTVDTIANFVRRNPSAGSAYLADPGKVAFAKAVADRYMKGRAVASSTPSSTRAKAAGFPIAATLLTTAATLGLAIGLRRKVRG